MSEPRSERVPLDKCDHDWSTGVCSSCGLAAYESLRRGQWIVEDVSQQSAVEMVERLHYAQGAPNTSVARHGLFRADRITPDGVAMWLPPTPTAARSVAGNEWRGVLALTRLVIDPDVPKNGASFLLGASMQLLDRDRWPWLLTYADSSHGHTGAIYRATNWTYLGPWPAGDTWQGPDGEQRGRKRGKRNLSVAEMTELGFTKRPQAVKHKYVHHVGRVSPICSGSNSASRTADTHGISMSADTTSASVTSGSST